MFENIVNFFKKLLKSEKKEPGSKDAAKERLHLVLMQDRANVSADFLELMKQEIIEVIKKYIEVDEKEIDVRLTNKENEDGTNGAPALYANIPILNIKNEMKKEVMQEKKENEEIAKEAPKEDANNNEKEEAKNIEESPKEKTEKANEEQEEKTVEADNKEENKETKPEENRQEEKVEEKKEVENNPENIEVKK